MGRWVIGGIFFRKQRQDLRDYGRDLLNGECKTWPWGNKVPGLSLHLPLSTNVNPLTFPAFMTDNTLHLNPHFTRNVFSIWCNPHLPFPIFLLVFLMRNDPREVTSIPSLIGCLWKDVGARRRLIISCFLVRWSRGRNTWISVRDHYC